MTTVGTGEESFCVGHAPGSTFFVITVLVLTLSCATVFKICADCNSEASAVVHKIDSVH